MIKTSDGFRENTLAENQAAIAEKAKHKVLHHGEEPGEMENTGYEVTEKTHTVTIEGKTIKDINGNIIQTHPIHRTKLPQGATPAPQPSNANENNSTTAAGDDTVDSIPPDDNPTGPSLPGISAEEIKKIADMDVMAMKEYFENNDHSLEDITAIKASEKEGRKRPQAYTLLNKLIKEKQTAE